MRPSAARGHGPADARGQARATNETWPRAAGRGRLRVARRHAGKLRLLENAMQFGNQVVGLTGLHEDRGHARLVGALVYVGRPVGRHRDDRNAARAGLDPEIGCERESVSTRQRDVGDDDIGHELERSRIGIFGRATLGDTKAARLRGTRRSLREPGSSSTSNTSGSCGTGPREQTGAGRGLGDCDRTAEPTAVKQRRHNSRARRPEAVFLRFRAGVGRDGGPAREWTTPVAPGRSCCGRPRRSTRHRSSRVRPNR